MAVKEMIPWRRPTERALTSIEREMQSLQRQMTRMLESLWPRAAAPSVPEMGTFVPDVDVRESDDRIEVMAELPGMSDKEIEVTLSPDGSALSLKGEKKTETYYQCERSYGAFRREIPLPTRVKPENVEATFKNGLLHIRLEKSEEAKGARPIEIKAG